MTEIQLCLGDCLDILPTLEAGSVDAVITDPPYGVQVAGWDTEIPPQEVLDHCLRISRGPVLWFGAAPVRCIAPTMEYDPKPDRMIVWSIPFGLAKTGAHGMYYRWHPIWCWNLPPKHNGKEPWKDVIECSLPGKRDWWFHPGTKPDKLMDLLVKAWGGNSVLDAFMGSGTTGVSCIKAGCSFTGIDNDPDSYAIAEKRIAEAQMQPRLEGI